MGYKFVEIIVEGRVLGEQLTMVFDTDVEEKEAA